MFVFLLIQRNIPFFDDEVTAVTDKSWEGRAIQHVKELDENTPEGCIIDSEYHSC